MPPDTTVVLENHAVRRFFARKTSVNSLAQTLMFHVVPSENVVGGSAAPLASAKLVPRLANDVGKISPVAALMFRVFTASVQLVPRAGRVVVPIMTVVPVSHV